MEKEQHSSVFSICGMCAVRCPIRVELKDGIPVWLEGNPHLPGIERAMCAKGAAGIAFEYDDERPQSPLMRVGPRGSGQWREVSWEEALDHIEKKLKAITSEHGARAIALADRAGPFNDLTRSFLKALGSPNYFDHEDTCSKNVNLACQSLFGYDRNDIGYDFKNSRHIVLYGRNVFESLQVKEANDILDAMESGAKLTYIDIRATVTAAKADTFLQIRPGTDYALNLALIHFILKEGLYDKAFAERWIRGLDELENFVAEYTPEWAAAQTGIPADEIIRLARAVSSDRPKVIFHGGWMLSRYRDSFYSSRALYILNALMGNIEQPGGLVLAKGEREAGVPPLRSLGEAMPLVEEPIIDGVAVQGGPLGSGHLLNLYKAIESGEPYPIKAFFAYRYDPVASLPDPVAQKAILDRLDLLVAIDVNYSQTAWYADLILPESTYLERANILALKRGERPALMMRRQAMAPRFDSKPAWEIFSLIARRMGAGEYFPYESIEEIWRHQLEGTGINVEEFDEKGFVSLADRPLWLDRSHLLFKTGSGKIEFDAAQLDAIGVPYLVPYVMPEKPEDGRFRLTFGRSAVHSHAQSQNNPYLNELVAENELWINDHAASALGITNGDYVEVSGERDAGVIRAKVTPYIHPEAVFMLHGFGSEIPLKTRSYRKGLSDTQLAEGGLYRVDPVGGGVAFLENTVRVRAVTGESGR